MAKKFLLQYAKILYKLTKDIEDEAVLAEAIEKYVEYLHKEEVLNKARYILEEFIKIKKRANGEKELEITVARSISDKIINQIKESFGENTTAKVKKDNSIIGGIVIKNGNKIIDGSVKRQFDKLKSNLIK
jgi:F-type H+-transporting ATPase subunit delta